MDLSQRTVRDCELMEIQQPIQSVHLISIATSDNYLHTCSTGCEIETNDYGHQFHSPIRMLTLSMRLTYNGTSVYTASCAMSSKSLDHMVGTWLAHAVH